MTLTAIVTLFVVIGLIGLAAWAITYFIPMSPKIGKGIHVLAGVFILLYVLSFFGLINFDIKHR